MVGSWFTSRWFAPTVLLILPLAAHGSLAADGKGVAITVFTKAPASATAGLVTALQAKARERGRLRVVAGLRIVLRP